MHFILLFTYHVYVCAWFYFFFDWLPCFHIFPVFMFILIYLFVWTYIYIFPVTIVLSIASPNVIPFQKICRSCHVANVIIFPICSVHYNVYCSKSTIQKLGFLRSSIITNDELVLLTIEGKWLERIVHMIESEFLDLLQLK
jgi:hypothetical protein